MGLVLTCVVRILHDDWSISLGENRPDRALKNLAAMLTHIAMIGVVCKDWNRLGTCTIIHGQGRRNWGARGAMAPQFLANYAKCPFEAQDGRDDVPLLGLGPPLFRCFLRPCSWNYVFL